ncbi:hypothetical protein Acr_00g0069930 [Actinidia rufa]|uniref:Uncharacterized protein n=1 Tax=Actinidia rufa TaxID=165716 RepID=A0A7J0DT87_9ERIC|nr:hypothetical protein Acr_00g0069930 [Actinidia rufa]
MSAMEVGDSSKKSKSKGKESVDYDSSRFTGKVEEKLYNRVWVESILTLCQEFMTNIRYNPVTKKGKERLTSWVRGKKLKVTPDTFAEIFQIPREENLEFELLDIGMLDLAIIFHELLLEGSGSIVNVTRGSRMHTGALLLVGSILVLRVFNYFATRTLAVRNSLLGENQLPGLGCYGRWPGKTNDLPRMMFVSLCATHIASDTRGSVSFTRFLTELFKKSGVHIPVDLIRAKPKRPIDISSLSRSDGQMKKRRLEVIAHEEPSIGMVKLKEEIMNLRMEMNTRMTALEEESSRHTTMLQEIKGILIQMQLKEEEEEKEEEDDD